MKIIIDENIAFANEAFTNFGEVELHPGREITNEMLKDASVLITRSVTIVNETLLKETKVKFVGTATIGWDHIDTRYLNKNNIFFTSAAGCNSDAVAQYVTSSLFDIAAERKISLKDKKIGIVGVGNIGSRIEKITSSIGMEVKLNDPPLARLTKSDKYVPLGELYDCDIITLHVPLNSEGEDKTYHLFNEINLAKLKDNCILINTSRGPVIDNDILAQFIKEKNLITVLDVWEDEPMLNKELLSLTEIATPHVAGYSVEGKINGTVMIYEALCKFLGTDPGWKHIQPPPEEEVIETDSKKVPEEQINSVIKNTYDIKQDDAELRKALKMDSRYIPAYFDLLRKKYPLRKQFSNYKVSAGNPEVKHILSALGFILT
jgi:erythronate-4-phosphate dehydrogenase